MKSRFRTLRIVIFVFAFVQCSFGRDAYVTVSTGEYGHGFFRQFQNECYVVTPKHVISLPGEITVITSGGDRASAEVFKVDSGSDLALLRVANNKRGMCSGLDGSVSKARVRDSLEDAEDALLHTVTADGSAIRAKVSIKEVTDQIITVAPDASGLQRGMSGSVLSVQSTPVGILIDVDKHGNGIVYRQEVVEDFWNRAKPRVNDCSQGCTFVLSSSNLVTIFQPSQTQGDDTTLKSIQTRFDYVYRVPDGWPLLPYFHVWQDKIEVDAPGVPPSVISTTSSFSFSSEPSNRAADIPIASLAFDTLGQVSDTVRFGEKVWTVTVSQERTRTELQVSIKPWLPSYGFQ